MGFRDEGRQVDGPLSRAGGEGGRSPRSEAAPDVPPLEAGAAERRLRALVHNAPGVTVTVDEQGTITSITPSIERTTGFPAAHYVGTCIDDHVHPDDGSRAGFARSLAAPGSAIVDQKRIRRADGGYLWAECTRTNLLHDPDVGAVVFAFYEVTEQLEAVGEAEARAHQQAAIAEVGTWALTERDPAQFVDRLLHTAVAELGVDRASLFELEEGGEWLRLRAGVGLPEELVGELQVPARDDRTMGYVITHGEALAVEDFLADAAPHAAPMILAQGVRSGIAVVVGREDEPWGVLAVGCAEPRTYSRQEVDFVTALANVLGTAIQRRRAETALERLAHEDLLTGLPNRASFEARAAAWLGDDHEDAILLLLDVDSLKLVNDAFGHLVGDHVLKGVAERLVQALPDDALVARIGGDELAALLSLPGGVHDARLLATQVAEVLAPAHVVDGSEVFALVSGGVATTGSIAGYEGLDVADRQRLLLRHADLALQRAKLLGRHQVEVFDGALGDDAEARLLLASSLRGAAERGELTVRYQPELALDGSGTVWAEALLRWDHPELGPVAPDRFIPIAEESGSIVEIGAWVLRSACRQLREWRAGDLARPAVISVNLSPRQLVHPGLVAMVERVLDEEGVDARSLTLEITETAVVSAPERAVETVQRLRALGVMVALDDFGTGYSSLTLLQRCPVDALKVDRSFVAGVDSSESDRSIVAAVLGLARALGLITVAEGVESPAQLEALVALGCEYGQGFLWCKALLPDDLVAWLATNAAQLGLEVHGPEGVDS
jgi:diguanylate cyclase (GGDEF)-like protein/PAS domain S-box-containing protein